ncbi:SH3 domain-containing protein [Sulfitobacter donghicola]|uniref:SH3 domain-containing protein n=1 Tax=Sulfitobacter donghicola TaxID=421000 RepID=UPI0009DDD259|nr:Micrococcal nuclease-like nuclease [Sulfitobacter donghicola DSW-25 = KCTC 12864 = JCM 14565]
MPFSKERTELILSRIRGKLDSDSVNDWEQSFLQNMEALFLRHGPKTNLSKAQFSKLHKILKLERPKSDDKSTAATPQQVGKPNDPSAQMPAVRTVQQRSRPRKRTESPAQIIYAPKRAIRRAQRKLFFPVILVMGILGLLSALFDSGSSSVQTRPADSSTYAIVTGSSVNQREGPSTNNRVMGQLAEGARVRVLTDQNGWSQITSPLGTGWMSSNYLAASGRRVPAPTNNPSSRTVSASEVRVIDGDTVAIRGQQANVRLVGFNAPETGSPACNAELQRGRQATNRLRILLQEAGSIQFQRVACACRPGTEGTRDCNYGRQCGLLSVDGMDVGRILIGEGLAVPYRCGATSCPPRPGNWCR